MEPPSRWTFGRCNLTSTFCWVTPELCILAYKGAIHVTILDRNRQLVHRAPLSARGLRSLDKGGIKDAVDDVLIAAS